MNAHRLWRLAGLTVLLSLTGCTTAPSEEAPAPVEATAKAPLCSDTLASTDVNTLPNGYWQAFEACDAPISDPVIVQRYIQALIVTGQFDKLTSNSLFAPNVDTELASQWQHWVEVHL